MTDVCSVLGGPGRKILNLIKGIEIEPTPQHRSHCTPPHNSQEHDERPVPQYTLPTRVNATRSRVGPAGSLKQYKEENRDPGASADLADHLHQHVATEKSPQRQWEPPDPSRRRSNTKMCLRASVDHADPFANGPEPKRGPTAPQIMGQQPPHAPTPPKSDMPTRMPSSISPVSKLKATKRRNATQNEYVLSKRGEIGAEFEYLRNNLRHCAQLTPLTNAPKLKGCLGTLSQSTDRGENSGTRLAGGPVPHPALERGMDENPKPLSGNRTKKAKVSDLVVRSSDAPNLSDNNLIVNVDKTKLTPTSPSGTGEGQ